MFYSETEERLSLEKIIVTHLTFQHRHNSVFLDIRQKTHFNTFLNSKEAHYFFVIQTKGRT